MRVFLIRHGQTAWSLAGKHTGRSNIPLTEHGETEARGLQPWLAGVAFGHVLSSPRQRAWRTASLAGLAEPPALEPDLAEWDYGDYEGELTRTIRAQRPDWSVFEDGCPGGEMPADIEARADRLIARLRLLRDDVALCSHGHFLCALAARWIGAPVAHGGHFFLNTASLSVLGFHPSRPDMPTILLWNARPAPTG